MIFFQFVSEHVSPLRRSISGVSTIEEGHLVTLCFSSGPRWSGRGSHRIIYASQPVTEARQHHGAAAWDACKVEIFLAYTSDFLYKTLGLGV